MKYEIQITGNQAFSVGGLRVSLMLLVGVSCFTLSNCSDKVLKHHVAVNSVSAMFGHFDGGVLFPDAEWGLDILWEASITEDGPYKENVAFFVEEGLLIAPNSNNTSRSASLSALPHRIIDNELFVLYQGRTIKVIGIIHTHPDGLPEPTPRNDFQFCYLGIHNFVMSRFDLYDAYKTQAGEVSQRIGYRRSYDKLPISAQKQMASRH